MESDVEAGQKLLIRFRARLESDLRADTDVFARLLGKSRAHFDECDALMRGQCNAFDVLGLDPGDEQRQSRFLAWLLDRREQHGEGNRFLSAFLRALGVLWQPEAISDYLVKTEHAEDESRIDVCVWRKGQFLIYIENKTWSPEGEQQLGRELASMRRRGENLRVGADRQIAVFLTPGGRAPVTGDPSQWRRMSYRRLQAAVRSCLPCADQKANGLVSDWLQFIAPLCREEPNAST